MLIVDAHEDIAWNMLDFGRDYSQSVATIRAREAANPVPEVAGETLLGWPEWRIGQVGVVFATLFAHPACHNQPTLSSKGYRTIEEAHHLCQAQLQIYRRLVTKHPDKFYLIKNKADFAAGLTERQTQPEQRREGLVLLMEVADAIR
jgi:membrane dipeptidase